MYDLEDFLMKSFREDNGISSAFSIEPPRTLMHALSLIHNSDIDFIPLSQK